MTDLDPKGDLTADQRELIRQACERFAEITSDLVTVLPTHSVAAIFAGALCNVLGPHHGKAGTAAYLRELAAELERDRDNAHTFH